MVLFGPRGPLGQLYWDSCMFWRGQITQCYIWRNDYVLLSLIWQMYLLSGGCVCCLLPFMSTCEPLRVYECVWLFAVGSFPPINLFYEHFQHFFFLANMFKTSLNSSRYFFLVQFPTPLCVCVLFLHSMHTYLSQIKKACLHIQIQLLYRQIQLPLQKEMKK